MILSILQKASQQHRNATDLNKTATCSLFSQSGSHSGDKLFYRFFNNVKFAGEAREDKKMCVRKLDTDTFHNTEAQNQEIIHQIHYYLSTEVEDSITSSDDIIAVE